MKKVFIVKQYQYDNYEPIVGEPVYVFDTEKLAIECVKTLNRKYAEGVIWVKDKEYLTVQRYEVDDYDTVNEPHFYTYQSYEVKDALPTNM